MNIVIKAAAVAAALVAGTTAAGAQTLTFSDLTASCYGGGCGGQLPNMTDNGQTFTYTSNGYTLSLITSNPAAGPDTGVHIGDGTNVAQTFNWHDGSGNQPGAFVTLTKVGGGLFDLVSFDYASNNGFTMAPGTIPSGAGFVTFNAGAGSAAGFLGVSAITFYGNASQQLDNLVLNAAATAGVPEPAMWALMILGFGATGTVLRRRAKVTVRYA